MSPKQQIENFAQSVYLTIKNRYLDGIEDEDGQLYVSQIIDWLNMFLDELENVTDDQDQIVDWWFARSSSFSLGTATAGGNSTSLPAAVDRLITDENRYVQIVNAAGAVLSNWAVVHPKDVPNRSDLRSDDMCALVGSNIQFSRSFRDGETNGTIQGDVILKMPRASLTNAKILSFVKPKQLLILGVAKNATLPDIVQGKLSPSYVQKYNNLLQAAIKRSAASSVAPMALRDNFSYVQGV